MRRRAFVQLTGIYAATMLLPTLSGCSTPLEEGQNRNRNLDPDPRGTAAAGEEPESARPYGTVDPGSLATGNGPRAFGPDGQSATLVPNEHYVDLFAPSGERIARLGDPARAGSGDVGTFNSPVNASWDASSRLLVLERGSSRVQAIASSGKSLGIFTSTGRTPTDLGIDPDDRSVYVTSLVHRIEVFSADGRALRTIGRFGTDGAGLNGPMSVAVAPDGLLHVADSGSARIKVFTRDGRLVGEYGASGGDDARLVTPRAIRFDSEGRAWVADTLANMIRVYDAEGRFLQKIAPKMPDGRAATPLALTPRADGKMYVSAVAAG